MKAWQISMKAIGPNDIWTQRPYAVVVNAQTIEAAIKRARAWTRAKPALKKVEIISALVVGENHA